MRAAVSDIFKALGHPARVQFVKLLGDGEKCVCELVESVNLGWSTVSRHLSVLKEAGIVTDEKRGLQVFYKISLPCVSEFIACLEQESECACQTMKP
ncbi:ArsR/SmtB family transcription factor [Coraliomargarita sp. W4R72]